MRAGVTKRNTGWTHVAFVTSMTDPDEQYEIKKRDNGQDGCECKSYQFSRGVKTCKHLRAYYAGEEIVLAAEPTVRAAMRKADVQTISFEGESFAIRRRAIGGLDAMLAGAVPVRAVAPQAPDWPRFEQALGKRMHRPYQTKSYTWSEVRVLAREAWQEVHGG
jgi:hypothetical protein